MDDSNNNNKTAMSWWNLAGMNPKYKDFVEAHPDKTMLGMAWAFYWRFLILVAVCEIAFLAALAVISLAAKFIF